MAPTKRKTYDLSDPFIASDPDSPPPRSAAQQSSSSQSRANKRSKPNTINTSSDFASAAAIAAPQTDSEGNPYWSISTARRVTLSEFKGKKMVSVREYYQKGEEWLPGKKGITMTLEQYSELLKVIPQIEKALGKEDGGKVGRPDYSALEGGGRSKGVKNERDEDEEVNGQEEDGGEDSEDGLRGKERRANIEATSDEDED